MENTKNTEKNTNLILNKKDIQIDKYGEIKYKYDEDTNKYNLPWIIKEKEKMKVRTDILAQYIKYGKFEDGENILNYYFVSSSLSKTPNVYIYENGKYTRVNENIFMGEICKFIPGVLRNRNIRAEILNELLTASPKNKYAAIEDFNGNVDYINFKDGIFNIKTKEFKPHTPDYKSIIQINANYKDIENDTNCPIFEDYLNTLCDGDENCKKILLQILGLVISNIPRLLY